MPEADRSHGGAVLSLPKCAVLSLPK